ncbi:MAG TPA: glutamine amidotransferase [Polyangiaceae bacterium]|nr:glutamine amidotransferase [Polyangiaceae bacterium]
MSQRGLSIADGVSAVLLWSLGLVLLTWVLLSLVEARSRRAPWPVTLSALVTALLVAAAVLRPTLVTTRGNDLFPKVVVLMDRSWRLGLKSAATTREEVARGALADLRKHLKQTRLEVLGFGEGAATPFNEADAAATPRPNDSDLTSALRALAEAPGERPKAIVVVSDGRLTSPSESADADTLRALGRRLSAPIHTIRVADDAPPDASIRRAATAGTAVAHQKLALQLTIGCSGGLSCDELPITVEELLHGEPSMLLAQGSAKVRDGLATVELPFTLDRAGRRLVRVRLQAPDGDKVPENDTRILTFDVTRERVRVLHVAGRPTYDVRALRMWLKADESIDLIAFFILRTNSDSAQVTDESELSLIPFPVDELFTEHLPSFDAVVLQDIDAVEYKLERHLPALARYVRAGGGVIMVGGPSAFMGGGYAGSPLAEVLPAALPVQGQPFDTAPFEPRVTDAGRAAPTLRAVRELLGDRLPQMQGMNTIGALRPGSIVLWEHPERRAGGGAMPVLSLGESGDGRSIALAVDGTHLLEWSEISEQGAGRAYSALWEGLVGWLMRDPRYESARLELTNDCRAGLPVELRITRLPGPAVDVNVSLEELGSVVDPDKPLPDKKLRMEANVETVTVPLGALGEGGFSATVRIGSAPPTRFDFACERGGVAFADSRPDPVLLERLAQQTGGVSLRASSASSLKAPPPTRVASQRMSAPLLPAWVWALLAGSSIGVHWYLRRRAGLI